MGEYQYYEFQALDQALTSADKTYIKGLSSRVVLTAANAKFVYNYSDFRGEPEQVLDRCFDVMLYIANFGVRRLMFRLPKSLINLEALQPYCVPYCITTTTTEKSVILNIQLVCEDYYTWIGDDEFSLASLIPLRDELLRGDFRALYLAWLQSGFTEEGDDPEDLFEPPVPLNLQKLSPALKAFADLFLIDQDLITAAAEASQKSQAIAEPIAEWIAALPEAERNQYLLRVAQGETHVGSELMQRLRKQFSQPTTTAYTESRRTLAELIAIADQKHQQRQHKKQQADERAKRKKLVVCQEWNEG
jgi:hypothetical protein